MKFKWNVYSNDVFKDSITPEKYQYTFTISNRCWGIPHTGRYKFCENLNDFIVKKAKDCNICKAYSETNSIKRNKKNAQNNPGLMLNVLKQEKIITERKK